MVLADSKYYSRRYNGILDPDLTLNHFGILHPSTVTAAGDLLWNDRSTRNILHHLSVTSLARGSRS